MLRPSRASAALLASVLALGLAACGDDDEGSVATSESSAPAVAETTDTETDPTATTGTETTPATDTHGGGMTAPDPNSPESQEGGAGDEVPASSQAMITGRGGKLSPAVVHVPPFIAIRVQLRSADGVQYELRADGHTVAAGGEIESASTLFDGLKAGQKLVLSGSQGKVTIEANAEPGP